MLEWLSANVGNIAVVAVLLLIMALIVRYEIRRRRSGKCSCGADCGSCGSSCCGFPKGVKIKKPL